VARTDAQPTQAEENAQDRAGQELIDLAALMSGLPLQHTTSSGGALQAARALDVAQPHGVEGTAGTAIAADRRHPDSLLQAAAEGLERGSDSETRLSPSLGSIALTQAAASAAQAAAARGPRTAPPTSADAAATGAVVIETQASAEALTQAFAAVRQTARAIGGLDGSADSTGPLATAWAGSAPRSNDTALPFQAELRAALGSSEFAPALGTQLSVLVRDGIEHAQLKLNPAEMGPIEVRIRLDGSQAQVDFSASQAGTRQALQDAVPALASALRESGLTLTGGGVFDQPREPRGEARQQARQGTTGLSDTTRDNTSATAGLPRMPRARGVVDLYA